MTDVAEGLDRIFRSHPKLKDDSQEFDAVLHSTGMLVLRSWLVNHGATAVNNPRTRSPVSSSTYTLHRHRADVLPRLRDSVEQLTATAAPVVLDISELAKEAGSFFTPFTTTLLEIQLNREPLPLNEVGKLLRFIEEPTSSPPTA